MKLSDYILDEIVKCGVKHVFFVPGGAAMHLNDSLGKRREIEFVSNLHEQASAIAAEANARVTGNLGVCMVTAGPGATNAVTGLAGAWLDSTPVLFLSGQVKSADLKRDSGLRQLGVQEVDIVKIVEPITKYAVTVDNPADIRFHLEKALHLATSGRKGPVWLDLPLDVQAAEIHPQALRGFTAEPSAANDSATLRKAVQDTLELLAKAERPVIMAGNGIRMSGAVKEFHALIRLMGAPVQTTWLGLDLIADNDPLCAGRPGSMAPRGANFTLQNADFLLVLGSRLDMALTGYAHERFARAAKKVVVDIDPAEIKKLKMDISVPVVADAGAFLRECIRQLGKKPLPASRFAGWLARIQEWKKLYPLKAPPRPAGAKGISAYDFSMALSESIPEDTLIVPGSSGFASEIFLLMLRIKKGQRCFHNRGTGSMGFAIPAAIGASMAAGRASVVSVDGDGGFQFNIQELATVARLGLPIKFFVINNAGYASIRASQNGYFQGNRVGCDATSGLRLPELSDIAQAYNILTDIITEADDIPAKIKRVLQSEGPVVCDVHVLADEPREPRLSSMRREDGSMVSKPLEDLFPFLERDEFLRNMIIPPVD